MTFYSVFWEIRRWYFMLEWEQVKTWWQVVTLIYWVELQLRGLK